MASHFKMCHPDKENMGEISHHPNKENISGSLALEREKIENSLRIILANMKSGPSNKRNPVSPPINKGDLKVIHKSEKSRRESNKNFQIFEIYSDHQNTNFADHTSKGDGYPDNNINATHKEAVHSENNINITSKDVDDLENKVGSTSVYGVHPEQMDDSGFSLSSDFDDTPSMMTDDWVDVSVGFLSIVAPTSSPSPVTVPSVSPPPVAVPSVAPPTSTVPSVTPPQVTVPSVAPPTATAPSVTPPPATVPSVAPPTATVPSVSPPPVTVPSVAPPTATVPSVTPPQVTVPSVAPPAATAPSVTPPQVTVPSVAPPLVAVSSVVPPSVTVPSVVPPYVTVPSVTPPSVIVPSVAPPPIDVPSVPSLVVVPSVPSLFVVVPSVTPFIAVPSLAPPFVAVPSLAPPFVAVSSVDPSLVAVPPVSPSPVTVPSMAPPFAAVPSVSPPIVAVPSESPLVAVPSVDPPLATVPSSSPPTNESPSSDSTYLSAPEYSRDIYLHLRLLEANHILKWNFMVRQPDITHNMRSILIDWLVEVASEYKLLPETLHLTISYIDRFLSVMAVHRTKLQLVGITAMLVACKVEEVYPPNIKQFIFISDDSYTKKQIFIMEKLLLKVLEFDLSLPTSHLFVNNFCNMFQLNDKCTFLAEYLNELAVIDGERFLRFSPSILAASSVAIARHTLGKRPWTDSMALMSGYSLDDLSECLINLFQAFRDAHLFPQQSVREKYKTPQFFGVAYLSSQLSHLSMDQIFSSIH